MSPISTLIFLTESIPVNDLWQYKLVVQFITCGGVILLVLECSEFTVKVFLFTQQVGWHTFLTAPVIGFTIHGKPSLSSYCLQCSAHLPQASNVTKVGHG